MNPPDLLGAEHRDPRAVSFALDAALNNASARALELVVEEADALGLMPYLVGGIPRDLLLRRSLDGGLNDLDVVVEGDAPALARRLAALHGGSSVVHERFQTATWHSPQADVDLVTARREAYSQPAALPSTEPADLDADLRRRDFSINAIAIALSRDARGEILDPCSGLTDLRVGSVRALHDQSFLDDPTRGIRAARFASRLGFEIDPQTREWIASSLQAVAITTGARLAGELIKTMAEPSPSAVLRLMSEVGLLDAISPALGVQPVADTAYLDIDADVAEWEGELQPPLAPLPSESREVWRLLRLIAGQGEGAAVIAERLDIPHRQRAWLAEADRARRDLQAMVSGTRTNAETDELQDVERGGDEQDGGTDRVRRVPPDSLIERSLDRYMPAALLLSSSCSPGWIRNSIRRYAFHIKPTPPLLDGEDLRALGVERGPEMGRLLKAIRARQLDDALPSREGGLAFVIEAIRGTESDSEPEPEPESESGSGSGPAQQGSKP